MINPVESEKLFRVVITTPSIPCIDYMISQRKRTLVSVYKGKSHIKTDSSLFIID